MDVEMKKQQEQIPLDGIEMFENVLRSLGAIVDNDGDLICLNCGAPNECCRCGMEGEW